MSSDQDWKTARYLRRVERASANSPEEKVVAGPRLFDRKCRLMMVFIRKRYPDADEQRQREIMREWLHSEEYEQKGIH
jgi:hypothetical protein